jgi:hypothetical protein
VAHFELGSLIRLLIRFSSPRTVSLSPGRTIPIVRLGALAFIVAVFGTTLAVFLTWFLIVDTMFALGFDTECDLTTRGGAAFSQ